MKPVDGLRSVVTKISLVAKARGYVIDSIDRDILEVLSLVQQLWLCRRPYGED